MDSGRLVVRFDRATASAGSCPKASEALIHLLREDLGGLPIVGREVLGFSKIVGRGLTGKRSIDDESIS